MIPKKIFLILIFLMLILKFTFSQAEEEKFIYDSKGRRDPFLSLISSGGYIVNFAFEIKSSDLNIEGIIYDYHGESLAIVSGKVVQKGDYIGNFRIEEIYKDKVIFRDNNEKIIEIKLEKEE